MADIPFRTSDICVSIPLESAGETFLPSRQQQLKDVGRRVKVSASRGFYLKALTACIEQGHIDEPKERHVGPVEEDGGAK